MNEAVESKMQAQEELGRVLSELCSKQHDSSRVDEITLENDDLKAELQEKNEKLQRALDIQEQLQKESNLNLEAMTKISQSLQE